jgi:uncharacterized RDD family membrane protein YckC
MACPNHPTVELGLERCARCAEAFCPDCAVWLRGATYCAACKNQYVRDILSGIVPGALDLAAVGRRFLALWLDSMLTTMASYALLLPLIFGAGALSATAGRGSEALTVLLMVVMYPLLFGIPLVYEALMLRRRGQTLGKMALGLRVVTPNGNDISAGQAWGRAALRLALGTCLVIDYIPAFLTREKTCLHDLIAKTRVVRVQR